MAAPSQSMDTEQAARPPDLNDNLLNRSIVDSASAKKQDFASNLVSREVSPGVAQESV